MLFQMLYANNGSLLTRLGVRSSRKDTNDAFYFNSYNGEARLIKNPLVATKEPLYKTGIPATFMDVRGWEYQEPNSLITPIVMNLTNVANNARLDFSEGGLPTTGQNPDINVTLDNANKATFPVANPNKVTLKVVPTTGAYTGTFEMLDGTVKRPVTFQGLIIPAIPEILAFPATASLPQQAGVAPTGTFGAGYFLLDQLPTPTTERRSGKAKLSAQPLTFISQPQSLSRNPGEDAEFSFSVTGGINDPNATLSYQWRKNGAFLADGTGITGATTSDLNLTAVDQSDEGSYECLIKKTVSITPPGGTPTLLDVNLVTTQSAVLTVNDPISDIILTQTPPGQVLPVGTLINFSIEHKGTAPFEYQWQKDNIDIPGATNSNYEITTLSAENAGSYRVIVKNEITPAGSISSAKTVAPATPVTTVTATRSPDSGSIAAATPVTFTATSDGSEPRTYQWLKNDVPIPSATGQTFTINSVSSNDIAVYKVLVRNSIATSGIVSNEVPLHVTQGISNIQIAKSFPGTAVAPNTLVTFTVSHLGTPPFTYQWRKNGTNIDGASTDTLNVTSGPDIDLDTPDIYDLIITNDVVPQGVASQPIELKVAIPVSDVIASRTPSATNILTGTSVTFSVTATGTSLRYQWRKGSNNIQNATASTYTIATPTPADSALYSVLVFNLVDPIGVSSEAVGLTVMDAVSTATATLTSPASATVSASAALTFTATATGGSGFTYQWRKNGNNISGATDATLSTSAEPAPGNANYDVRVFNPVTPAGILSNQVTITVQ